MVKRDQGKIPQQLTLDGTIMWDTGPEQAIAGTIRIVGSGA